PARYGSQIFFRVHRQFSKPTTEKARSISELSDCQPEREDRDPSFRKAIHRFRIARPKGKIAIPHFGMQFFGFGLATRKGRSRSIVSECNSSLSDWQPEREDRDPSFRKAILRFRVGKPKGKIAICPLGMQFIAFGLPNRKRRLQSVLSECNSCEHSREVGSRKLAWIGKR